MKCIQYLIYVCVAFLISEKCHAQYCYRTASLNEDKLPVVGLTMDLGKIEVSELNNDDYSDIVGSKLGSGRIYYFLNDGTNQFVPIDSLDGDSFKISNINGDDRTDIIAESWWGAILTFITDTNGHPVAVDTLSFGSGFYDYASGDVNHDGFDDLVVTYSSTVEIYAGDGAGNFALIDTYPWQAYWLSIADMNSDGSVDVIGSDFTPYVYLLHLDVTGMVTGSTNISVPSASDNNLKPIDINGDSLLDIVVLLGSKIMTIIQTSPNVYVIDQQIPFTYTSWNANPLIIYDFNNDAKKDVLVTGDEYSTLFYNTGVGFNPDSVNTFYSHEIPFQFFDVNHDLYPDLVNVDCYNTGDISFLINHSGEFTADPMIVTQYASGTMRRNVKILPFDSDTLNDIVFTTPYGIEVYKNLGDEKFRLYSKINILSGGGYSDEILNFEIGDFNNNGKLDVILPPGYVPETVVIIKDIVQNGFGSIQTIGITQSQEVTTGDFNADGNLDFAVNLYVPLGGTANFVLYLNDGAGSFVPEYPFPFAYSIAFESYKKILSFDIDNDNDSDIVINTASGIAYSICTGPLTYNTPVAIPGSFCDDFTIDDYNKDGFPDVMTQNFTNVQLFFGSATGFTSGPSMTLPFFGKAYTSLMNDDSIPDIIVDHDTIYVIMYGDGSGNFINPLTVALPTFSAGFGAGNLNADKYPDMFSASYLFSSYLFTDTPQYTVMNNGSPCNGEEIHLKVPLNVSVDWFENFLPVNYLDSLVATVLGSNSYFATVYYPGGCQVNSDTLLFDYIVCDSVWPGDVDMNGACDLVDFLKLTSYLGSSGPPRVLADTNWFAHYANTWSIVDSTGLDLKFYDCDGNGLVELIDTSAIVLNFGLTHAIETHSLEKKSNVIRFIPEFAAYGEGQLVKIDVVINDSLTNILNITGLALSLNYECSSVQIGSLKFIPLSNSWLGTINVNAIKFSKINELENSINFAIARTDQINISGNGKIGTIEFMTLPVLSTVDSFSLFSFNSLTCNNVLEINSITDEPINILISPFLSQTVNESEDIIYVYPNPSTDRITLACGTQKLEKVTIYDMSGKTLLNKKFNFEGNAEIVHQLVQGYYIVEVLTDKGRKWSSPLVISGK